ncbi:MAG: TRAP transporter large permease subunit [Clostridiales bacterium]|jgi:C4-dicarboxylate transporter DctM subunit|nr:TRAP transporter large permease subunit [Clostridiales bacterium]
METAAAIIILTPILVPIAVHLGIDKVHFGIIMIMNLAIGLTTPPVGINLYVASNISNAKIEKVCKASLPFLAAMIVSLLMVTYAPGISLIILQLLK